MNGEEIAKAIADLELARSRWRTKVMREYDESVFRPVVMALYDECTHEPKDVWEHGGMHWAWRKCRFCGKVLAKEPMSEIHAEMINMWEQG